jgi:DNA-binding transcriptional LysR family regulator
MELRQLRYALAVARRLSFTQAAADLALAQPALSQQIAALEADLGVKLFERTSRRVTLTDAGRALIERAERVLGDVDAAREEMTAYAGGLRGRVVVGTYQSFSEYRLPKLLGRFHAQYPGIEIALREGMADDLFPALASGKIDVFVGDISEARTIEPVEFAHEPLYEDELSIAVAASHPLAARHVVSIHELRDERWIIFRPGSQLTQRLVSAAHIAGFDPRVAFESVDSLTVRALVAEGLGIALFPRTLGNTPGPNIALVSLAPEKMIRTMSLVTRKSAYGPSAKSFIAFLRDELSGT